MNEILASLLAPLEHLSLLRAGLAFVLVFFLPGFAWTLVFFAGRQINVLERVALSFGLSIALVTLIIFALNLVAGIKITGMNSLFIIVGLTLIPAAYYCVKRFLIHSQ